MSIPEQIDPNCLSDYLEVMTRAVFQASLSWKMIEKSWAAHIAAFKNFDPSLVACFSDEDIEELMKFEGIIHNKKKIIATIKNARTMVELDKQYHGFQNYLRSKSSYEELSKDMRKRFSFLGELSIYYFLFRVKEPVPEFEKWISTIEGEHPRMREMVEAARKNQSQNNVR